MATSWIDRATGAIGQTAKFFSQPNSIQKARTQVGQAVAGTGQALGLGTVGSKQGIGASIAGLSQPFVNKVYAADLAPQIGPAAGFQYNTTISSSPPPGGNSGNTGGSGGSTGQVFGDSSSAPMESYPQQGGIDYDALIAPALQALDQSVAPAQSGYEADVQGIEQNRLKGKGELENSLATGQRTAATRRGEVTKQSENAVDEARRQFSEISQGLQARYGGTTGSGAFVEGLAGRQTLQNIGQQRQALTQAVTQIDNKLEEVRSLTDLALQDNEQQAQSQKAQAKAQLDNTLNSIRMAKGELMAKKVEYAQQAMQFYQSQVAQVEARNTQFKQQLYQQQQAAQQKLAEAKAKASSEIEKFSLMNLGTSDAPNFNWVGSKTQTIKPAQYGVGQLGPGMTGGEEDDFVD